MLTRRGGDEHAGPGMIPWRRRAGPGAHPARPGEAPVILLRSATWQLWPDLAVGVRFHAGRPATRPDGDRYGFSRLGGGSSLVALATIYGETPGAAAAVAAVRRGIRSFASAAQTPALLLQRLQTWMGDLGVDQLCAVVLARCRSTPRGLAVTLSAAGQPPPLLLREGHDVEIVTAGGPALGYRPHARFEEATILLGPDETLLLYSDLLIEQNRIFRAIDDLVEALRAWRRSGVRDVLGPIDGTLDRRNLRRATAMVAVRGEAPTADVIDLPRERLRRTRRNPGSVQPFPGA